MLLTIWSIIPTYGQKRTIDSSAYNKFPALVPPILSNDGKHVAFISKLENTRTSHYRLTVKSVVRVDSLTITIAKRDVKMTGDSRYCLFMAQNDKVGVVDLHSKTVNYIPNVSRFEIPKEGGAECLLYPTNDTENQVIFLNLCSKKEQRFEGITQLSPDGKILVVHKNISKNQTIDWINLINGRKINIWKGNQLKGYVSCDFIHNQLAFQSGDSIFYYKTGMKSPRYLINIQKIANDSKFTFGSINRFSKSGRDLLVNLETKIHRKISVPKSETVEVWSYTDKKLQSVQQYELGNSDHSVLGLINLDSRVMIQLQRYESEQFHQEIGDNFLSSHSVGNGELGERTWNSSGQLVYDLINIKTGKRKELNWLNGGDWSLPTLSPSGRYIIYYDTTQHSYCSYDIDLDEISYLRAPLKSKNAWLFQGLEGYIYTALRGIAGWMTTDDERVLIYDSFDIWVFDLSGKHKALNLTNGYGARHNIVFTVGLNSESKIIPNEEPLILNAFNVKNKQNGFFAKLPRTTGDPQILSMGSFIYKVYRNSLHMDYDFTPIRAKNSDTYIVMRMSATDAPNYFSTNDFRTFRRLTNDQPQKDYNWYTTELHSWKSLDGHDLQGILYKPENFNPTKKYPVIFNCYERVSDGLNSFIQPTSSMGNLDVPTYTSNGYLVFSPDIYYKTGDPMQGTYDAVVSAANYVSGLSYVNPKKMGIQGQSWGAMQTNSLITRTNVFAAACSSSSMADWVAGYGSIGLVTGHGQAMGTEKGQLRMGTTLWESLSGYLKNSPILFADKVTTPLLMKHGKLDEGATSFSNALEFFLGLRRLGKKVWLLTYPKAGHVVQGDNSKDFTFRMAQFFDFYLKDKPAPYWMLDGIPAIKRGIDSGFELDKSGRVPGKGILTAEQQKMVDSLMTKRPTTITFN